MRQSCTCQTRRRSDHLDDNEWDIRRADERDDCEKPHTRKRLERFSASRAAFLSAAETRCANEGSLRQPKLSELHIQQLFKHVAQLVISEKSLPGAQMVYREKIKTLYLKFIKLQKLAGSHMTVLACSH